MKLTIKNISNIAYFGKSVINIKEVGTHDSDTTYQFKFTHTDYKVGTFTYVLHRDMKNDDKQRWVGTLRHPYGSYRLDCYECDLLDKTSFLYFLSSAVDEWNLQYNINK